MTFAIQLPKKIYQMPSQVLRHVKFVLPWCAKKGQYAPASSSLGVSQSSTWPSSRWVNRDPGSRRKSEM
jgi:hypothetical protein